MPAFKNTFSTPISVGLYGLLLSSGKSIFVFSPVTALAPWGLRSLCVQRKEHASLLLGLTGVYLVFYAAWCEWSGDWSYGPRFMIAILPFLAVASAFVIEDALDCSSRHKRTALWAMIALSTAVQIPGIAVDPQMRMESIWQTQGSLGFERRTWNPYYCPVVDQTRSMFRLLRGESASDVKAGKETIHETELSKLARTSFDFWWIYVYKSGLLPAWLGILVAGGCLVVGMSLWMHCLRYSLPPGVRAETFCRTGEGEGSASV